MFTREKELKKTLAEDTLPFNKSAKPFTFLMLGKENLKGKKKRGQKSKMENIVEYVGHFYSLHFPSTSPLCSDVRYEDVKNIGMYTFPMGAPELKVWPFVLPHFTIKIAQQLDVIFNKHQRPPVEHGGTWGGNIRLASRHAKLHFLRACGRERIWHIYPHLFLN